MLAKSYSKMMKSIGEDLKHIGPFSAKQQLSKKRTNSNQRSNNLIDSGVALPISGGFHSELGE